MGESNQSPVDSEPGSAGLPTVSPLLEGEGCLAIIATYNEIDNLPLLLEAIHQRHPRMQVLVIDDNSPDGTGRWADDFARKHDWCHLLSRPAKQGLGSAAVAGFRWALQRDYQRVLTMDADFSHDPGQIHRLLAVAGPSDENAAGQTGPPLDDPSHGTHSSLEEPVVIGSRYVPGGQIEGWPWTRRWASGLINRFARLWLRLPTRDNSGAFRCYPTSLLRRLDLGQIRNQGYGYLEEILYLAQGLGARMVEVPITFRDRTRGKSKINAIEALRAIGTLLRLGFQRRNRS